MEKTPNLLQAPHLPSKIPNFQMKNYILTYKQLIIYLKNFWNSRKKHLRQSDSLTLSSISHPCFSHPVSQFPDIYMNIPSSPETQLSQTDFLLLKNQSLLLNLDHIWQFHHNQFGAVTLQNVFYLHSFSKQGEFEPKALCILVRKKNCYIDKIESWSGFFCISSLLGVV